MKWHLLLRGLGLLAVLVGIGILIKITPLGSMLEQGVIDDLVKGHGLRGQVIFIIAGALLTAIGFSRQAVAFMGGYAFGLSYGILFSLLATAMGCGLTFCYARYLGRSLIASRFSDRIKSIDLFLSENPFAMTLLIRLLPVGSNLLTNLAAGLSSVPVSLFVGASTLGYIPQMAIFSLLGSGVHLDTWYNIALSVILFIASGLIGLHLYRKHRHRVF